MSGAVPKGSERVRIPAKANVDSKGNANAIPGTGENRSHPCRNPHTTIFASEIYT